MPSKDRTNPAAIGVFISGAIVVLLGCLVLFGGGHFFRKTKEMLLTFREPVTGLEVGAPVKLMGVTVGTVKDIFIEVDVELREALLISVVAEIDRENSQEAFRNYPIDLDDRTKFDAIVDQMGLRGKLEVLSLLSGQLYVALNMEPVRDGFQLHRESEHGYWEIPTIPSTKYQLIESVVTSLDNLAQFDFKSTSEQLTGLLADVRAGVGELQLQKVSKNLGETMAEAKVILGDPNLRAAIANLNSTLIQVEQLAGNLNSQINPLLSDFATTLQKAAQAFDKAVKAVDQLNLQLEPGSTLTRELVTTLQEAGAAMQSLRRLAEQIERNPSSLLTGKKEPAP